MNKCLLTLVLLFILPFSLYSTTATITKQAINADNPLIDAGGSETAVYQLLHAISRASSLKTTTTTAKIDKIGRTKIGTITINNNTRDGYKLTMTPEFGTMRPVSNDDGETAISYAVQFTRSGDLGEGIDFKDDVPNQEIAAASEIEVLSRAGEFVTSATEDLSLNVNIVIASSDKATLGLAGSYNDTITFTYTDL